MILTRGYKILKIAEGGVMLMLAWLEEGGVTRKIVLKQF